MNADKALAAESVVAIAAITTGDLLAQGSARGLPSPRRIVSTFLFYGILSLAASLSEGAARLAAAAGGVAMLATLVLGPGGAAVTALFGNAASLAETPEGSKPSSGVTGTFKSIGAAISGAVKPKTPGPAGSPITGAVRTRGAPIDPVTGQPATGA